MLLLSIYFDRFYSKNSKSVLKETEKQPQHLKIARRRNYFFLIINSFRLKHKFMRLVVEET